MGRLTSLPSAVITDDSALGGAVIEKSLRFNKTESAKLSKTFSSDGNLRTFTFSSWCKISSITSSRSIFSGSKSGVGFFKFQFRDDDRFEVNTSEGGDSTQLITTAKFRDTNAWYHVVVAFDSTQSTSTDRCKLYINGTLITAYDTGTYPPQNTQTTVGSAGEHNIGNQVGTSRYFDGYMAEVNFIDGIQLDPSHFGYTEFQTGIWRPKGYFGSYNANGFRLDFLDNSGVSATTIGKDRSGQGNDFTPSNFSVSAGEGNDSFDITPTKQSFASYETNDPVTDAGSGKSYRQGGYTVYNTGAIHAAGRSSFPVNSGKWYAEFKLATYSSRHGSTPYVGAARVEWLFEDFQTWIGNIGTAMNASGATYRNSNSFSGNGVSYSAGDIISVAIDLDNGKQIWWAKNGTYINSGNPATTTGGHNIDPLSQSGYYVFATSGWASTSQWEANFGQRPFSYSVPAGFKTLQVDNLPDKTLSIIRPQKHFGTLLYTATGNAMTVTGLDFKPDLIWQKRRDSTGGSHFHYWFDSVRGGRYILQSNTTQGNGDSGDDNNIVFRDGGFDMAATSGGQGNGTGGTYAAWCWKAGGNSNTFNVDGKGYASASAAGITEGNLAITGASINREAGFSIVKFTANNNASATIGHGLNSKPKFVIVKDAANSDDWQCKYIDDNIYVALNTNQGSSTAYGSYTATDTLINLGYTWNNGSGTHVAYSWTEIPGYSKFGVFKGNGSDDGKFIFTGMRPAWVLIKNISSGSTDWIIKDATIDTLNVMNKALKANTGDAEFASLSGVDFYGNGFKIRNNGSFTNGNNDNYFYMAFAEQSQFTPYDTQPNAR